MDNYNNENDGITEFAWGFAQRKLNSNEIPKIECPNCKKKTLIPTRVVGSPSSGSHTIDGYCKNCGTKHTNLKNLEYYKLLHDIAINKKKS